MLSKTNYFVLLAFVLLLGSCGKFSKLQKKGTTEQKLEAALNYYKKAEYYKAGLLFEEILPLLNGKPEAETATFYNAYCQYHQGLYSMSQYMFKNFYDTYARSDFAQESLYMYTYSLYKDSPISSLDQSSTMSAISAMQDFVNTFPESAFSAEATKLILELREKLEKKAYEKVKLYYKTSEGDIRNFKSSVVAISNFQREFPDSKYNEELSYLKVDAEYKYGMNSFFEKQKERFQEAVNFYQEFVDKYPTSKFIRSAEKVYDESQKELARIIKVEKEAEKAKAAEKAAKLTIPTSSN